MKFKLSAHLVKTVLKKPELYVPTVEKNVINVTSKKSKDKEMPVNTYYNLDVEGSWRKQYSFLDVSTNQKALFYNGFCRVKKGNKWGFVNEEGTEIVECKYLEEGLFERDPVTKRLFAAVKRITNEGASWGFVDNTGVEVIPCRFDEVDEAGFYNGQVLVSDGSQMFTSKVQGRDNSYGSYALPHKKDNVIKVKKSEDSEFIDWDLSKEKEMPLEIGDIVQVNLSEHRNKSFEIKEIWQAWILIDDRNHLEGRFDKKDKLKQHLKNTAK